jgi:hypothetical protein
MAAIIPVFVKVDAGLAVPAVERSSLNLKRIAKANGVWEYLTHHPKLPLVAGALYIAGVAGEQLLAPAMEWLRDDPPDENFRVSVRLKRSHMRPSFTIDASVPIGEHALRAFRDIDFAAAAMRAMLRATEREEGARAHEDRASVQARASDGERFRREEVRALAATARSYEALATDLEQLDTSDSRKRSSGRPSRSEMAELESILVDSRVPAALITAEPPREELDSTERPDAVLLDAARACTALGESLGRWRVVS